MAIEIVDFPIKNGEFPYSYVSLPEGNCAKKITAPVGDVVPTIVSAVAGAIWPGDAWRLCAR